VELTNAFTVRAPVDEVWRVLTDLERIAPCMPGAELQEVDGDDFRGVVKVKVGPITARYEGTARIVERDDAGRRAVVRAEGRDTRGQGNAAATITATVAATPDGSRVEVVTDLSVTGKVAQFGRSVMADVSAKLLEQFVVRLEADVLAGSPSPGATAAAPDPGRPRSVTSRPAEPIDLLATAGAPLLRRAVPLALLLVGAWLLRRRRRRRLRLRLRHR
jgi:carbon monoxide dehydrogenase subunit G